MFKNIPGFLIELSTWLSAAKLITISNFLSLNNLSINSLSVISHFTNSKLSKQKLIDNGFEMLPTWQNAVERYSKELENNID